MKCFYHQKLTWTVHENWSCVIFSDETKIMLGKNNKIHVWRKPDKGLRPECLGEFEDKEGTCQCHRCPKPNNINKILEEKVSVVYCWCWKWCCSEWTPSVYIDGAAIMANYCRSQHDQGYCILLRKTCHVLCTVYLHEHDYKLSPFQGTAGGSRR